MTTESDMPIILDSSLKGRKFDHTRSPRHRNRFGKFVPVATVILALQHRIELRNGSLVYLLEACTALEHFINSAQVIRFHSPYGTYHFRFTNGTDVVDVDVEVHIQRLI